MASSVREDTGGSQASLSSWDTLPLVSHHLNLETSLVVAFTMHLSSVPTCLLRTQVAIGVPIALRSILLVSWQGAAQS
jgi:hypothetical protein